MAKSMRRGPRKPADPGRGLLDRIRHTPHLPQVIPRLHPELLHRVIQTCGLEDCGDLVAMATPDQLERVFDLDLWRPPRPGLDEQLDADRFGVWLEVLMESGAGTAAQKLVGIDVGLVVAALAQHARVFDGAAVSPYTTLEGVEMAPSRAPVGGPDCEVGGYLIEARRTSAWDAIVDLLVVLDAEHSDYFHRLMRGCRALSNSTPEVDGLHDLLGDREQDMFDLSVDRERRREKSGYVAPAEARAFLQSARKVPLNQPAAPAPAAAVKAYFRSMASTDPIAVDSAAQADPLPTSPGATPAPADVDESIAAVADLLADAGIVAQPRGLLHAVQDAAPRLAGIQSHLRFASAIDPAAFAMRTQELAYLANTILAGCSIQARPFTAGEASEAAAAICNLGLENWPRHWLPGRAGDRTLAADSRMRLPDDFLVTQDLVGVFEVGWTILHDDVCMVATDRLVSVLTGLQCGDRETQSSVEALRVEMAKQWRAGTPWRARDAMDVIAILDLPAWAGLLGLIDECPVMHASLAATRGSGTLTIDASAFTFISENGHIEAVRDFLQSLPEMLRP